MVFVAPAVLPQSLLAQKAKKLSNTGRDRRRLININHVPGRRDGRDADNLRGVDVRADTDRVDLDVLRPRIVRLRDRVLLLDVRHAVRNDDHDILYTAPITRDLCEDSLRELDSCLCVCGTSGLAES